MDEHPVNHSRSGTRGRLRGLSPPVRRSSRWTLFAQQPTAAAAAHASPRRAPGARLPPPRRRSAQSPTTLRRRGTRSSLGTPNSSSFARSGPATS
jgi:hypothetical protein